SGNATTAPSPRMSSCRLTRPPPIFAASQQGRLARDASGRLRGKAGEPAPQRLHFRRAVEPQEPAKCGWVLLLEMLGPLDAQQRHEQERQQRRAPTIEGGTHVTVELAADPHEPALDQTWESQQHTDTGKR